MKDAGGASEIPATSQFTERAQANADLELSTSFDDCGGGNARQPAEGAA